MNIKIWDVINKEFVTNEKELMDYAGFEYQKFEDIGVQGDGTPVVFDTCGNFGYLDPQRFKAVFLIGDI